MRLGTMLSMPGDTATASKLVERAQRAERAGFQSAWLPQVSGVDALMVLTEWRWRRTDEWIIQPASAREITLRFVIYGLTGGAEILVPSLQYLFRVFKASRCAFENVDAA